MVFLRYKPIPPINSERTKAILQVQLGVIGEIKIVLTTEAQSAPKVPDAAVTEPKNPGLLSETCSTINIPLPIHSPPAQAPCTIRKPVKSSGAIIPRTEYEGNSPIQKVLIDPSSGLNCRVYKGVEVLY